MSAAQRLHGEHADTAGADGANGVLHLFAGAVLNADACPVNQRMYHLNLGKARGRADAADEVRAHAHRADMALFPLLREVVQRLLVAAQRVEGFLLMQHEQVDIVAPRPAERALQRLLRRFAVVAVGLGANDIIRRAPKSKPDMRIGFVEIGRIQKADAALIGIDQQTRALLGRHALLQRRHGQRTKAQPGHPQPGKAQRYGLHYFLSCSVT